jgi:hypothetical protein
VWSWDLFYLTEYRVAASDLQDDGRILESFDIFICARVDQYEIARLNLAKLHAVITNGDVLINIICCDIRFAFDEELGIWFAELFNRFLVTGKPVVCFIIAERAACTAGK